MTTLATLQPRLPDMPLAVQRVPFELIPRPVWEQLLSVTPAATPFSDWTFQRAWWDAYADTAHEHYLLVADAPAASPPPSTGGPAKPWEELDLAAIRAIVPLMTRVVPEGFTTLFMAASYHADYATILAHPDDIPAVASRIASDLLPLGGMDDAWDGRHGGWDMLDLRRLREVDGTLPVLRQALEDIAPTVGWQVRQETEDVCPVMTLATDWETQLAGLSKKARHEVRRKLRRAEGSGSLRLRYLPLDPDSVEHLIRLHQARWGADGLFDATADGDRARAFLFRLAELEADEGANARFHIADVRVDDQAVYALAGFDDGVTSYFYNAGMDPGARELSPGVVGTAVYIRDRIAAGRRRFDFLRGDEAYKYQWGAVDERVHRLTATRSQGDGGPSTEPAA